jgi:hypothetical protein
VVSGLYGPAQIRVDLPEGWAVKAMYHDGRDVTDAPLESKSGDILSGLLVILTNHVTALSGQLVDDKGAPLADGTVLVFASESEKWSEDSRFVRAVRPNQQGAWQVKGLPGGEYLAVAVDYVEDGMWNDPEYLESVRRYAQKVTLTDGMSQTLSLRIVKP